eukprot:UN09577
MGILRLQSFNANNYKCSSITYIYIYIDVSLSHSVCW